MECFSFEQLAAAHSEIQNIIGFFRANPYQCQVVLGYVNGKCYLKVDFGARAEIRKWEGNKWQIW